MWKNERFHHDLSSDFQSFTDITDITDICRSPIDLEAVDKLFYMFFSLKRKASRRVFWAFMVVKILVRGSDRDSHFKLTLQILKFTV